MHFPLFLELQGASCLVVGGGSVARRKARALRSFGAQVDMVAPELSGRGFADNDLAGRVLVVAATNDRTLNGRISALCREQGIPVNVVDDPANCTFIFPAITQKGPLTVAVSSDGTCPVAAKMVRDKAERLLSDDFVSAVEDLGRRREELKVRYPDPTDRMCACEEELSKWND